MAQQARQHVAETLPWHERFAKPVESILVPIEYSEPAFRAAEMALDLARGSNASLTLLHLHISDVAVRETVTIEPAQVRRTSAANLRTLMLALVSGMTESTLEAVVPHSHAEVAKGSRSPSNVIVDFAEAHRFDLIVMGARSHSRLHTMLLGDVAEEVITEAPCHVMLLH